jgi:hypothetical protein
MKHYDIKALPAQYLAIILHALGKQPLETAGGVYQLLVVQKMAQDQAQAPDVAPLQPPHDHSNKEL